MREYAIVVVLADKRRKYVAWFHHLYDNATFYLCIALNFINGLGLRRFVYC
jgi:hypothetical protein